MRDRLLAAVHSRLARFTADGDVQAVLSEAALDDVAALRAAADDPATDLEVLLAAGCLHWYHYLALDPGDDQQDLTAALTLLAPVYQQQADAVPDDVRQYFDVNGSSTSNDAETLADEAAQLLGSALNSGDVDALDIAIDRLDEALAAIPTDRSYRALPVANLGLARHYRFQLTGAPGDLDDAVEALEAALSASPPEFPQRAWILANAILERLPPTGH